MSTIALPILFSDATMLVINKPAGLLSQPGRRAEKWDSVMTRIQRLYPEAVAVHRLDEPTSGLMMVPITKAMGSGLSRSFRERLVNKRYEAIVTGIMEKDEGSVDYPLMADWPNRPRQKIDFENGRPSLTYFQVLERNIKENWTRVDLEPYTGRTHQLRMHMMGLGHPILGDPLYADPESFVRTPRMYLHARHLSFEHPTTRQFVAFNSAAPF